MFRAIFFAATFGCFFLVASAGQAGVPPATLAAVTAVYVPATPHKGLLNAAHPLEPDKIHGYGVVAQGAIPAEKAEWFITNIDFDYRPSVVDLAANTLSTRRGRVYTYLQPGQVMLVTDVVASKTTIYLKLLSADQPIKTIAEAHPSRLACLVGFKFKQAELADPAGVLATLDSWIKSFPTERAARDFAQHGAASTGPSTRVRARHGR